MGATCSTKSSAYHEVSNKRNSNNPTNTEEKDLDIDVDLEQMPTYKLGTGADVFFHQFFENSVKDPRYMEIIAKYDIQLYFLSTLTYVCRGDGVLGEPEKEYIIGNAKAWQTPKHLYDEFLKGKDYSTELSDAALKLFKDLKPNASDKELKNNVKQFERALLCLSIMAATQDGLVKSEYENAQKLAKKLNLDQSYVDQCVDIIKTEILLQSKVERYLSGKFNKI